MLAVIEPDPEVDNHYITLRIWGDVLQVGLPLLVLAVLVWLLLRCFRAGAPKANATNGSEDGGAWISIPNRCRLRSWPNEYGN
jgi:hypothetical protein